MNELGFTETFLKDKFSFFTWKLFLEFMVGQTVSQVNGETTYYYCDVLTFCVRYGYPYPGGK